MTVHVYICMHYIEKNNVLFFQIFRETDRMPEEADKEQILVRYQQMYWYMYLW